MGRSIQYTYEVRTTIRCAKLPDYDLVTTARINTTRAELVQLHLRELMNELKVSTDVHSFDTVVIEKEHRPTPQKGRLHG